MLLSDLTMSVLETGLGRAIEEEEVDEKGFNQWFTDEAEDQKKEKPLSRILKRTTRNTKM